MRTLTKLAASTSFLAFVVGCADVGDGPTALRATSTPGASSTASGPVSRPAGGSCTTEITVVPTRPGYALSLDMTGTCQLAHLGRTTMVIQQDFAFDGSIVNSTTHTAANGDLLLSNWYSAPGESTSDGINAVFAGTETYVGGTGRFADVSGSSRVQGTAVLNFATGAGTGAYTTRGTIVY
jgi:hypothetical protein